MKNLKKDKCQICGAPVKEGFLKYCSVKCRNRRNYEKSKHKYKEWQRERRDKIAMIPSSKKVQCLVCGKWYVQLGSHVVQSHGFKTCREYREHFNLEVKKGIVPKWYKKLKGDQALKNKTYLNLKKGEKYHFKKGAPGVGVYERSPITVERLKVLHKLNLRFKKNV